MKEIILSIVETDCLNPFHNLAIEEYMTFNAKENEVILYLWQNQNTVVIGRNQNAWSECNISAMDEDGIFLARRISGGGAVFHDTGNLNFTFIARDTIYDTERQTGIILRACRNLGLKAEKTGRNDLVIDGRKFSGHAYYSSKGYNYHHGTILLDVSSEKMMKYLNVSERKLKSNGVKSVVSRVINIRELLPEMSLDDIIIKFKDSLKKEFINEYQINSEKTVDAVNTIIRYLPVPDVSDQLKNKYSSVDWRYGTKFNFEKRIVNRFSFGETDIQISLKDGIIKECYVYSDALNTDLSDILKRMLTGCRYDRQALSDLCYSNANKRNANKSDADKSNADKRNADKRDVNKHNADKCRLNKSNAVSDLYSMNKNDYEDCSIEVEEILKYLAENAEAD